MYVYTCLNYIYIEIEVAWLVPFTGEAFKQGGNSSNSLLTVCGTAGSSPGDSVITKAESNQSVETLLSEKAQLLSSFSSLQSKIFAQFQVWSSFLENVRCSMLGELKEAINIKFPLN